MSAAKMTAGEKRQVAEILNRRANEIAGFHNEYRNDAKHHGSVEFALSREIDRLRRLAERVDPPLPEEDDEAA